MLATDIRAVLEKRGIKASDREVEILSAQWQWVQSLKPSFETDYKADADMILRPLPEGTNHE